MDFQRYILIAAIAVLSFMLMTEWVHFQEKRIAVADIAAAQNPTADSTPAGNVGVPDTTAVGATAEPGRDIPLPQAPQATTATAPAKHYVAVHTDVLDVKIDLQGGDIVYVALPKFSAHLNTPNSPFVLMDQTAQRTYIAQSGLIGVDSNNARPLYSAQKTEYSSDGADELIVTLTHETDQHLLIAKRFKFRRGDYLIDMEYQIENHGEKAWQGGLYGQLKRDASPDPSVSSGGFGISSYLGAATSLPPESRYTKLPFKDIEKKPFQQTVQGGWIAIVQHYFLSAWIPAAKEQNKFSTAGGSSMYAVLFTGSGHRVAPGETTILTAQLYTGPKDQYRLEKISPSLDLSVDYGKLFWIAQPLFWLLTKIHGMLGNWGWSIMVLTLLVKAAFFWLNAKAYTSMAKMRQVQPKLVAIRERYADDRQKQSQEMMNLYKTEKINPLGGCLPVVVQMPVFLALYWVLLESVELRHAPWILWIKDLSAMDPYFILPVLMGASMFFQQRLNPPPPDPMQAKVMQWMPLIFSFFFLWFPAGLVLYYVVNNLLSIAQQYIITKRIETAR